MKGSQDFAPDPRNSGVLVYLNGALVPRDEARVSVFDAGFVLGDGVWEGLRLHKGALMFLDAHIDRLFEGARAIDLDIGLDRAGVIEAVRTTLAANEMHDGVHIQPDGDTRAEADAQPGSPPNHWQRHHRGRGGAQDRPALRS